MTLQIKKTTKHSLNWMIARPIAHRGLHDATKGIYENTLSASQAAIELGYNIELDIQPSLEMTPMVFHDYELARLTDAKGETRQISAKELSQISIHDTQDKIPTLETFLDLVDGQVGLVIELKGKDGRDDGFVESTLGQLSTYKGSAAIMSFDHHLLRDARKLGCSLPLGLTAEGSDSDYQTHKQIAEECDVDFVSYYVKELDTQFVREFKETGRPVISWTVRSPQDQAHSNKFADQVTFEGFRP